MPVLGASVFGSAGYYRCRVPENFIDGGALVYWYRLLPPPANFFTHRSQFLKIILADSEHYWEFASGQITNRYNLLIAHPSHRTNKKYRKI